VIGNSPPPKVGLILDQQQLNNAQLMSGFDKVVFLAGPYIDTNKTPRKNSKEFGKVLRYHLYHQLTEAGWNVTMGEYTKLIDTTADVLGRRNNALLAELNHAKDKKTNAIVMLPSSPGSFLELGSFCTNSKICNKMLIIVDQQYEHHKNYMNTGPIPQAKNNGATIEYKEYSNIPSCWEVVENFVNLQAQKFVEERIITE